MATKRIIDEEGIEKALNRLTDQIAQSKPNAKNTVLIGVITRGSTLAKRIGKRLSKQYGIELQIGSLDTRPHRDDMKDPPQADRTEIPFNVKGKNVILVDDVASTGRTIRAAMDALIKLGRPKTIKTAVLIDRGHRELPISADWVGKEVLTSTTENIRVRLREDDAKADEAIIEDG